MLKMETRVLQILDTLNVGSGVASVVLNYYRAIQRLQHKNQTNLVIFDFMVNEEVEEPIKQELENNNSRIFLMPPLRMKYALEYCWKLEKFFKEHTEYQIIHGHVPNAAAFYFSVAKKANVPVRILHSHNSQAADQWWKQIRNRILSKIGIWYANQYMACGKKAAQYLYGKNCSHVYLMNNVVDAECFRYRKEVRKVVRKNIQAEGKFVIGHVGRFCYQKNQKFLIQIFAEINKKEKNTCLLLLGEGEERQEIEKLIEKYHLEQAVKLLGVVPNVEDYMQAMDVFLLPSRYEGVPISVLEAQASGLPCVISSEVTKEVKTEYTDYIKLKEDKKKWRDAVLHWKGKGRCGYLPERYNSVKQSIRLLEKYRSYKIMGYEEDEKSPDIDVNL